MKERRGDEERGRKREREGRRERGGEREEFEGMEASGSTQVEGSVMRKTEAGSHFLPKTSFIRFSEQVLGP